LNQLDIIRLTSEMLPQADKFAARLIDNRNFTHFRHTSPTYMLNEKWEVYVTMCDNIIISWGQIEKFPNNFHKQHVCRLGFAVLTEFQNQGYGSRMMDYVVNKCDSFDKMTAAVYFDNKTMLTMFLQRGFVIEGFFVDEERFEGEPRHVISLGRR
jgi:GNAT superfamily N-acetyltransferase